MHFVYRDPRVWRPWAFLAQSYRGWRACSTGPNPSSLSSREVLILACSLATIGGSSCAIICNRICIIDVSWRVLCDIQWAPTSSLPTLGLLPNLQPAVLALSPNKIHLTSRTYSIYLKRSLHQIMHSRRWATLTSWYPLGKLHRRIMGALCTQSYNVWTGYVWTIWS